MEEGWRCKQYNPSARALRFANISAYIPSHRRFCQLGLNIPSIRPYRLSSSPLLSLFHHVLAFVVTVFTLLVAVLAPLVAVPLSPSPSSKSILPSSSPPWAPDPVSLLTPSSYCPRGIACPVARP